MQMLTSTCSAHHANNVKGSIHSHRMRCPCICLCAHDVMMVNLDSALTSTLNYKDDKTPNIFIAVRHIPTAKSASKLTLIGCSLQCVLCPF